MKDNEIVITAQKEALAVVITEVNAKKAELERLETTTKTHSIEHEQLKIDNESLKANNDSLNASLVILDAEIHGRNETITSLDTKISRLEAKITELTAKYDAEKAKKDKGLALLGVKLFEITQQIENRQTEEELVRKDLANWQSRLEERDKNLRIRESKVEQGENKMLRNSDLLNL